MPHSLLLVDDEPAVLRGLTRIFHKKDINILSTTDPREAVLILERNDIGVIVSDYRMPGMTGVELLEIAQHRFPDTVRILLTGQADFEAIVAAINQGEIYKFLSKPCDPEILVQCVSDAFLHYDLICENCRLMSELSHSNEKLHTLNTELEARVESKVNELIHLRHTDPVTSLPNRISIMDRLDHAVSNAARTNSLVILMLLGIDRFGRINESFGHKAGDELLSSFAARVLFHIRETDTLASIGGDEFAILIQNTSATQDAERVAKRILHDLASPFSVKGNDLFITIGIGISVLPTDGSSPEQLFSNAAAALHKAKSEGRHNYLFYSKHLNDDARRRLRLEADLRRALDQNNFVIHYQPRVNARSGHVVGVEALLRLEHPDRGLVSPGEFIPSLEDTGLIVPVGTWIVQEVKRASSRWHALGLPPLCISVNLSPKQFSNTELLKEVQDITCQPDHTDWLEFELTEGLLISDQPHIHDMLRQFHEMNITLAIDDFGTGYSSLSYLTRFPIDVLKIDQSFIRDICDDENAQAIVQAIISMSHALRLKVVAEGVETTGQKDVLDAFECDEYQGFLFGKPVSEEEFIASIMVRTLAGNARPAHGEGRIELP